MNKLAERMDEGMWNWKKKDPKWLGDWDRENDHREETGTLKMDIKLRNEGISNEKLVEG